MEKPGLPNLHKVTDNLYRGAQPTAEGFKNLKEMGIKTVVNLRAFHSDRDELKGLDLSYENIDVKTWHAEDEDLVRFLKIVTDKTKMPVFVHCQHGADRTGMMVAVYRIAVQGWTKADAMKEMTEGGFGWHPMWQNLLEHIEDLDIEALKKEAGLSETQTAPASTGN
jgi:protein tyrosine/serine phosphatase